VPDLVIEVNPTMVRKGNEVLINVGINSAVELSCQIQGGVNQSFTHAGDPTYFNHGPFPTGPLNATQVINVDCTSVMYPSITASEEIRVDVIPSYIEI
jgi:hypothetical protein